MYKSLLDKVSRGRNLPPKRAAFFMAGTIPEKWRIYGIFCFCYHDFADFGCCAGRWPGRVGRCQSAGGLRLGQPWLQCSCTVEKHQRKQDKDSSPTAIPNNRGLIAEQATPVNGQDERCIRTAVDKCCLSCFCGNQESDRLKCCRSCPLWNKNGRIVHIFML